ncbi:peroxide stress protein YaaA [Cellulosimicrobium cellulans]|uniref:YaaA family protein n=1 Tax=Cellulosimicrobium cellulans TaxID=1710 RepID=UPI00214A4F56|nr:peroxide stress protein YaaA [Cellulosimicrobium cellulans]
MLVLLPPSEGKTPAPDGAPPVDLDALTSPALTAHRVTVLDALAAASARPDAHDVLGTTPGLAEEVRRNTVLRSAPAGPAADVYTGVLYGAADLAGALAAGGEPARRACEDVRVVSGLWGALSPADRVPAYRLSMAVDLPGVGRLATAWRPRLAPVLDERAAGDVVVDCRSATYVGAWKPRTSGPSAAEWVAVRVVREHAGKRTVVSHNAKHTRGVLAGHLVRREAAAPSSAAGLLDAARELVGTVIGTEVGSGLTYRLIEATLHDATTRSGPRTLELVIS